MLRIGVDLSSGEKDSLSLFTAVEQFLQENEGTQIVAFVELSLKEDFHNQYPYIPIRCEIVYTQDDIKMEEIPSKSLLNRTKSAVFLGLKSLREKRIDAFFSPGNSGAVLILAKEMIGLRKRISFPAVSVLLPRPKDFALLLDAGASFEFDDDRILELFYLGREYYHHCFPKEPINMSILNVGKERYKGSLSIKRSDRFLKKAVPNLYKGFSEGFDIFGEESNVFITNAYTGNIILKSWEGFLSYIFRFLKDFYPKKDELNHLEGILSFLKEQFHYSQIGAACILGLRQYVYLGHGRTSHKAILGALNLIKTQIHKEKKHLPKYIKKHSQWAKQFQK